MAKLEKIEDLEVWRTSRLLCNEIFTLIHSELFSKDYALTDQINRSSGSIMDNIAEGFERSGNRELSNFFPLRKVLAEKFSLSSTEHLIEITSQKKNSINCLRIVSR